MFKSNKISKTYRDEDRRLRDLCVEEFCCGFKEDRRLGSHGACADCGVFTCNRGILRIEPGTLRRRLIRVCWDCERHLSRNGDPEQDRLRELRTKKDWKLLSDPVDRDSIAGGRMPEQYASRARASIRAFVAAGFEVATVHDADPVTLNMSASSLGLQDVVFAESRNGETVLRRIEAA